jgi:hypothetical protein
MTTDDLINKFRNIGEFDELFRKLEGKEKEDERVYDKESGLLIYEGNRLTDFYKLDIEKRESKNITTVKTTFLDKLTYYLSGKRKKDWLLKKVLYPKYLKDKEEKLEERIARDNISKIKLKTERTYDLLREAKEKDENRELDEWKRNRDRTDRNEDNQSKPTFDNINYGRRNDVERKIITIDDYINDYKRRKNTSRLFVLFENIKHNNDLKFKEEMVYQFNKYFKETKTKFMQYIPMISIECENNSINSVLDHINRGKIVPSSLRDLNIGRIIHTEYEPFVFLPELVLPNYKKKNGYDMQWNLQILGLKEAHEITKGRGATVGVIDTGVDYTHSELEHCFDMEDLGYDFVNDCDDPMDQEGHGTHVAGTVAGEYTGVAPAAKLYAIRVLDSNGMGSLFDVMSGVEWAIRKKLDVINLSLGSQGSSKSEEELYKAAYNSGMCICAAAGNDGDNRYNYPAAYDGVIAVAAIDRYKKRAYFSNMNDKNDLAAPGVDIRSSVPNNGYELYNGTSMATPHVSGVCALAKSYRQESSSEIEKRMKDNAENLGIKEEYGAGLVRADKLLKSYKEEWRR